MIAKDIIIKEVIQTKMYLICYNRNFRKLSPIPFGITLFIFHGLDTNHYQGFGVSKRLLSNIKLVGKTIEKKRIFIAFPLLTIMKQSVLYQLFKKIL